MKKNIGNTLALYPTPTVVVGATVNGKASWTLVAHVGIVAHDRLLVSLHSAHYINKGIKENGYLSVNIVTEDFCRKRITAVSYRVARRIRASCSIP